jgi:hypothetical protein
MGKPKTSSAPIHRALFCLKLNAYKLKTLPNKLSTNDFSKNEIKCSLTLAPGSFFGAALRQSISFLVGCGVILLNAGYHPCG